MNGRVQRAGVRAVSACLIAAVVLAGCGVPRDQHPQVVSARGVPLAVRRPMQAALVYFVFQANRVGSVSRDVPLSPDVTSTLRAVVKELQAGPTAAERERQYSSTFGQYDVRIAGVTGETVLVDISSTRTTGVSQPDPASLLDTDAVALGQLVYTLTSVPGIDRVDFERNAQRLRSVYDANYDAAPTPVTRKNYEFSLVSRDEPTIYLVRNQALVLVKRERIAAQGDQDDDVANAYLQFLVDGPTDEETQSGIKSLVADFRPTVVEGVDGSTTLRIANGTVYEHLDPASQALALAQLLFTISDIYDGPIHIEVDGQRVTKVPRPDGTLVPTPVEAFLYESLKERPVADGVDSTSTVG